MNFFFGRRYAALLLVLPGLWIAGKYVLPLMWPFLLAAGLALAAEPLVGLLQRRLHLPRGLASGIAVTLCLGAAAGLALVLLRLLLRELGVVARSLPDLEDGLATLQALLLELAGHTPSTVRKLLTRAVSGLFSDGTALLDTFAGGVLQWASGLVSALPDSALSIGTWVLACFMISGKLPQIRQWASARLPKGLTEGAKRLKTSLGRWLLAQCKLMGLTAGLLLIGFLLLGIPYAPVWAAIIALADALPVLGTGTVLVPWSLVCMLQGLPLRAAGLLGIYVLTALLRSVLEPRLVGRQLGLDPLLTLIALYAGFRLWGIAGLILAPLLAAAATQLAAQPTAQPEELRKEAP